MPNYKVCHFTSVHTAFDVRIFYKECRTLAIAGYSVTLIAQHDKNEVVGGVKIIALPNVSNHILRFCGLTLKAFRLALKEKAEVYHFHDPELLLAGLLIKLSTGKRVVYDVHEDYRLQILYKPYIPQIARKSIALLARLVEYVISKYLDGIVTATDDILNIFSFHKKAICLRNFPIISNFSNFSEGRRIEKETFNIIYVGNLTITRGITQIVQALEHIKSDKKVTLILCGDFYPLEYNASVRKLKGFEKVEYRGWVNPQDIPTLLCKSDVGIACLHPQANYLSALPIKLFEYMLSGIPVIASDFPLWKDIVIGNQCGICVDPQNSKEIAGAIVYLLEHPDERKAMGENGRKAVINKYNWENESKRLLDLYGGII